MSLSADTLAGLATKIGIDPARLQATVEKFNGFARAGVDGDFGRGNSAYDRYYGDPLVHPNPTSEHSRRARSPRSRSSWATWAPKAAS